MSWTSDDDHVDGLPVRRERNWSVEKEKMTIRKIVRDVYESDGLMGFWTGVSLSLLVPILPYSIGLTLTRLDLILSYYRLQNDYSTLFESSNHIICLSSVPTISVTEEE